VKHLIMGTAGHVDHGKTALTKALTGVDCDTHKEEKARGITINLGFTHLDLPNGDSLGIVDVPGHRDFVHTMVGGAAGIDLALLVVAADSGVMPQTIEHLRIMDVLGIRDGLVALTRMDLAEPEIAGLAEEEIAKLVRGTFLWGSSVVRVSAVTGEGLDLLKEAIAEVVSRIESRRGGEVFRLFPDRVFTVSGFGTVVTGSVIGGTLRAGGTAYLLPGGKELRVRRIERHGQEVEQVVAGDRASINLAGLKREEFKRGMILSDRLLPATRRLDAQLRLFERTRPLDLWSRVVLHFGTYEHQARAHLIDRTRLSAGETGLVQIHLDEPCVAQYGDRFVIRSTSNDMTLGGGEIIDPTPLHHRRRTAKAIEGMARVAGGEWPEREASEVRKRFRPVAHQEIADILNVPADQVRALAVEHLPDDIVCRTGGDQLYLIVKREFERLREACLKSMAAYHRRHPLERGGRTIEELAGVLALGGEPASLAMLRILVRELEGEQRLKRVGKTWALAGHGVEIGPTLAKKIQCVDDFLCHCRMHLPLKSDLARATASKNIERRELKEILRHIVRERRAYYIDGDYIHATVVDRCREMLLRALAGQEEGITVARFRDLVAGNRRICLPLLGIYDAEGVTERMGDLRLLTEKGRAHIRA